MKPHDSDLDIGFWFAEAVVDPRKRAAINTKPIDITKDQMIQVYLLLFPFLASEFVHRTDIEKWSNKVLDQFNEKINTLNKQLEDLSKELKSHNHLHPQGPTTGIEKDFTFETPKLEAWSAEPKEFTFGESLITSRSEYTMFMQHRNPKQDPTNYEPMVSIKAAYKDSKRLVPFDAYGDDLDTGDNSYVNK